MTSKTNANVAESQAPEQQPDSEQLLEQLKQERADFLNYRKRINEERATDRERERVWLLQELLPMVDELDRAFSHLPAELVSSPWVLGVALSRKQIQDAFERLGVRRFGSEGEPFDPSRHEALFFEPGPEGGDKRVISVVKPGYTLGAQLLRPAQVGVGASNAPPKQDNAGSARQQNNKQSGG
jgi:molecular chaperone GrpE